MFLVKKKKKRKKNQASLRADGKDPTRKEDNNNVANLLKTSLGYKQEFILFCPGNGFFFTKL